MNTIQYKIDFDVNQSSLTGLKKTFSEILNLKEKGLMKINPEIDYRTAQRQFGQIRSEIVDLENAYDRAFDSDLGVLNLQKFNQELNGLDLNKVQERLSKAGTLGQRAFTQLAQSALTTNVQLKQTTNWLDSIGKTLGSTIRWGISSRVMNEFVGTVQGAYGYVKELDKSLNDIRIVTGKSADEMRKFAKEVNTAAQNLGETTNSYTQASLIYYQQGLSDEETKARAETTLKAANVTGQSGEEVSEQLTAVWNGYKVAAEETELYVDKLAAVAATTASDLEELSTGMSKVASAASTTGVSIDELSAQMSTIISVTRQAPESVGTALKTIYARMTSLELGETDEDGMNLAKVTQSMSDMGIEVLDETGNLRDLGTVIEEVGAKWNTWTEAQRAAMAQTLAGTRQYNNLYALFENWDMYLSALETSQGSAGTLQKQQDTYMESTEAHLDRMAAAAENFQDSLLDDRGINAFADIMTVVTNLATGFVDSIGGGVGAVLNLGAVFTNVFKKQIATSLTPMIQNIGAAKFNKEQLAAVEKNLEVFKSLELKTNSGAKALTDYQSKMSKYWSLMSTEEKRASMEQAKEIARLTDLKAAWEEANQEVNEYASAVAKAAGKTQDPEGKTQGLEIRANQYNELGDLGQTIRGLSVDNTKNHYGKVFEKNKDGSMTSIAKKQTAKAMSQAKDLQDYIKVYEQYGQKLQQLQKIQTSGGKLTQAETELMKKLQIAYNNVGKKLGDLPTLLKNVDLESGKLPDNFQDIVTALQALNKNSNGLKELLRNLFTEDDEQQIEAIADAVNGYAKEMKNLANVSGELDQKELDEAEKERGLKIRANVEAVTEMTSAFMSMGSIINNISTLPNIIQDEDLSDGEKFVQVLTNIGSTALSSIPQIINLTNMIKTSGNAGATAGAQTAAGMAGATAGMQTATGAAVTLNSALGVIGLAAMALGAVFGVIGAVNTAIDNNNKALQEKNKATIEETKATTEQVKANNELYESYKLNEQQYKSGEMSKQELLNTTEDLINAYDIENGHLMRLTGNYEGLSLAIEKARKEEAKYALDAAKRETTAAKQNAELNLKNIDADWIDISDASKNLVLGTGLKEDAKKVLSDTLGDSFYGKIQGPSLGSHLVRTFGGGIGALVATGMEAQTDYLASFDLSSAGGIVETYDKLVEARQQLEEQGIEDDTLKNNIDEQIKALDESIPDLKAAVESIGNALVLNADAGQKLNLAENSKEASEYIANFRMEMEALNAELPESQRLTQDQLNAKMVEYLDDIENVYVQRQVVIGKLQDKLTGDAKAMVDDLTNEQLSFLMTCEIDENTTKETIENLLYTMQDWLDSDPDYNLLIKMRAEGISDEDLKNLNDDYKKALLSGTEFYSEDTVNDLLSKAAQGAIDTNRNVLVGVGENRAAEEREEIERRKQEELRRIENQQNQNDEYRVLSEKNDKLKAAAAIKDAFATAFTFDEQGLDDYFDYDKLIGISKQELEEYAKTLGFTIEELESDFRYLGHSFNDVLDNTVEGFDNEQEKKRFEELQKYYDDQVSDIESKFDAAQNAINELDFDKVRQTIGETINLGVDSAIDNIETLIDKIELIGDGFIVAAEDADTFIERFPALLENAKVLADGSIKLDQEVVESNRKAQEDKIKAQYDAQIAELDMQIELAKAQMEFDEANYKAMQDYVNGKSNESKLIADIEKNRVEYVKKLQRSQAAKEIDNFEDVLEQNGLMTGATIDNLNEVGKAAENVGKTIMAALSGELTDGFEGYSKDQIKNALPKKILADVTKAVKPSGMPTSAWEAALEAGAEDNFTSRLQEEDEFKATEAVLEDYRVKAENSRAYWENLLKQRYDLVTAYNNLKITGLDDAEALELLKEIFDIYHNVNVELGLTESHLNKLIDLQEQLTGQELLDNIREQNAYLEKQNQLTKDKYAIMSGEKEMYKQQLLNKGFKFDGETGAISNYWEAMEANLSYVNSEIEKYQGIEGYEDYVEKLEEEYEEMVEAVEKYDELLTSELPGLEAEMREIQKQIVENNIKAFDVEINMHLETKDVTSEWNDFIKDFTLDEDDFVGRLQQDAASGLGEITGNLMGESVQRAKEVQAEIIKMQNGEESEIFGTDMAKAQEKLKELQTEVINNATAFKEYCDSIEESYFNLLDNADERLEEHYSKYEQIQKKLTNSVRMTELVFGENAYGKKAELYEAQQQANVGELDARRREVEMWKQALAEATPGTEEYDRIYAHLTEAQNALEDKVIESLEFIKTKYENAVHKIFDDMNKELLGMSLDNANLEWEFATKMDDTYLDNIEKGYELQKLSYDYEKSKNGLSENALKRINALQAEQMEYLREKENLTQYDIDRANALLDIEMKRIALEEAENNKTSMRLRRDSQGNYSYQFVADQDAINEAKESLAEAERNLYDLDKEKFISTSQEMEDYLAEQYERWINADAEGKKIIEEETRKMLESMGVEGQTAYLNLAQSSQMAADSLGLNIGEISDDYMNNLFPQMDTAIAKTFGLGQSAEEAGEKFGSVFDSSIVKLKEVGDTYENEKTSIEESSGVFFNTIGNNASEAKGEVNDLNTATGNLIDVLNTEIDTGKGIYDAMAVLKTSFSDAAAGAADVVTAITNMVKTWNDVELKDIKAEMPNGTNFTTDVGDVNYQDPVKSGGGNNGDGGVPISPVEPDDTDEWIGKEITWKKQVLPVLWYSDGGVRYMSDEQLYGKGIPNNPVAAGEWKKGQTVKWKIVADAEKLNPNNQPGYQVQNLKTGALGFIHAYDIKKFDTGGYTGEWNDTRGRLALLHQKELILNAQDTPRMLEAINITREMQNFIEAMRSHSIKDLMFNELELSFAKAAQSLNQATEAIQQQVQIEANFPDVKDAKEIEEALNNLVNMASQYAYRSKR